MIRTIILFKSRITQSIILLFCVYFISIPTIYAGYGDTIIRQQITQEPLFITPIKEKKELLVGILSQSASIKLENSPWKQTFDRLNQHPDYYFSPLFLDIEEIDQYLYDDKLDFVICDAINYLIFSEQYDIFHLLTRRTQHSNQYISYEGLSVYTLADNSNIIRLNDLKNKKLTSLNDKFSNSALFLKKFLNKHQLNTQKRHYIDTNTDPYRLINLLKNHQIDALIAKAGLMEEYFNNDILHKLRLINPRKSGQSPFLHSSELIPEWAMAQSWFINETLGNQVAALLLDSPENTLEENLYFFKQYHWGTTKNYQILMNLDYFSPEIITHVVIEPRSIYSKILYWVSLMIIGLLVIVLILHIRSAKDLNKRLTLSKESLEQEINERQLAQEQVMNHQADLAHVARLSTMGEMASGLAHELNQPLSAINTYVSGCIRRINMGTDKPDEILNALKLTVQQAERADSIIRRLRSFVRKGESHKTYSDINHLVNEVTGFLESQLKKTNTRLTLELEQQLPPVLADIIQIEQVLVNLLKNSLEAMQDNDSPSILISTRQANKHVIELCVIDSGEGISEDTLKRIFNPFFTTKSSGMGMGLSISSSIIETHDGKLYAHNNTEKGATFCFTLPTKQ